MEMKKKWSHLEDLFLDPEGAEVCRSRLNGGTNGETKGLTLTWSDLTVYVKQYKKKFFGSTKTTYKKLVNNVAGAVESGKLVALMGPSGAGKSTILYALANRHSGMLVDGDIRLNGKKVDNSMCNLSGLMRQEDIFIPHLTVKEHLYFMARLKLDRRLSSAEKEKRIISLINDLGLSHCINRKIGGSASNGENELSGGERKRLSFATACLPDPPLLFCDEPTTGLDSLNAIRLVSMMASWNATILCTIHQPSPEILRYFSSVILVADGSLVFSGSIEHGVDFFKSAGYDQPSDKSAGEFLVSCVAPVPGSEGTTRIAVRRLAHQFALSEYAKTSEMHIQLHKQPQHDSTIAEKQFSHKSPYWLTKFFWLFLRSFIEVIRNPQIQWIKIAQKIIVGLTSGLCYIGTVHNDQAGVQAVQGALFVLVAENTFAPMYAALALFPRELPLLLREMRDGDYHPSALYLAKILSHFPGLALEAVLFTTIVYWLANLRDTVFAFFMILALNILCVMVSAACGIMFANIFDSYELANIYLIPFDNAMMILSGALIKVNTLSAPTSWLKYFSWLMYNYEAMTILQWQDVKDITCSETWYLPCMKNDDEIFEHYSFSEDNLYPNIISMVVLYMCFHIVSYIFFVRKIHKRV